MIIDFSTMKQESSKFNERSDCAVKAVALACEIDYSDAHRILGSFGRRPRSGTRRTTTEHSVNAIVGKDNWHYQRPRQVGGSAFTPKTIAQRFPTGRHMVFVRGHVFALINGVVQDWTAGRRHRITEVWTINPGSAPTPVMPITPSAPKKPSPAIKRPKRGSKTEVVWAIADRIVSEQGGIDRTAIINTCIAAGVNPGTAATQFARWKRFQK